MRRPDVVELGRVNTNAQDSDVVSGMEITRAGDIRAAA